MVAEPRLRERLPDLIDRLVATYSDLNGISHLGHCPLPSHEGVVAIAEALKEVLYPGYRRREGLHLANVAYYVGELLDFLHDKLSEQIGRALCHESQTRSGCNGARRDRRQFEAEGQAKTLAFLEQLPELRRVLMTDVEAAFAGDPACKSLHEVIFCYPGLEAITVYRLAHLLAELEVPLIPRMMTEWAHGRTGIDMHPGARIGGHFFIDHGTGVVIGETCEIGQWVKIYQGVTLGALSFPTHAEGNVVRATKRHPTIQDGVVIYANATILGGRTVIGHDCVIGSNVWLTRSVEPRTTVIMENPRLRIRGGPGDEFTPDYVI